MLAGELDPQDIIKSVSGASTPCHLAAGRSTSPMANSFSASEAYLIENGNHQAREGSHA